MKRGNHVKTVWVGFSDGMPHVDRLAESRREPAYCVFRTRAEGKKLYEDVRRAALVWPITRKRR